MKISKNQKYIISKARLKKQILKHTNENLFISSDLSIPQLKKYLSDKGDIINTPDDKGETILSYSIIRNKTEVSKYIISNFNNINLNYYDKNGKSYLHKAVLMKNYEMMTELIDKGINVNCQDNNGNTPLHLATIPGDPRAIKILVYGHGRVNMVNSRGETPMILARNNGNLRCINAILKKKNFTNLEIDCGDGLLEYGNGNIIGNKGDQLKDSFQGRNHSFNLIYSNLSSWNNNEVCTTGLFSRRNNSKDNEKIVLDFMEDKEMDIGNTNDGEEEHKIIGEFEINNINDIDNNNNELGSRSAIKLSNTLSLPKEQIELISYQGSPKNFTLKGSSSNANNNFTSSNNKNSGQIKQKEILHPNLNFENFINSNDRSLNHIEITDENINLTEELNSPSNRINESNFPLKIIDEINCNLSSSQSFLSQHNSSRLNKESFSKEGDIYTQIFSKKNDIDTNYLNSTKTLKVYNYNITHDFRSTKNICENIITDSYITTINNDEYIFLKEINMEKYIDCLISNGFDDIGVIIEQSKRGIGVTERNLKEACVPILGDRAKIIVHIDEYAGNFNFQNYNKDKVYHEYKGREDEYILELERWLKGIKMDMYIDNFIACGYYSLDLILIQMLSKQPHTEELLENEIKIDKIGYRARIMNKLKEDAIKYNNKMISLYGKRKKGGNNHNNSSKKEKMVFERKDDGPSCQCLIA